ncbi:MAG: hypothetical protein ABGX16_24210 [Pirellulales bacterium]
MKSDLIFTAIALPFTIGFGMVSTEPIWGLAIFSAMLLVRYAGAPASAAAVRKQAYGVSSQFHRSPLGNKASKADHFRTNL